MFSYETQFFFVVVDKFLFSFFRKLLNCLFLFIEKHEIKINSTQGNSPNLIKKGNLPLKQKM